MDSRASGSYAQTQMRGASVTDKGGLMTECDGKGRHHKYCGDSLCVHVTLISTLNTGVSCVFTQEVTMLSDSDSRQSRH